MNVFTLHISILIWGLIQSVSGQNVADKKFHIVGKNENFFRISLKYNFKQTALLTFNPQIKHPESIEVGDTVWLSKREHNPIKTTSKQVTKSEVLAEPKDIQPSKAVINTFDTPSQHDLDIPLFNHPDPITNWVLKLDAFFVLITGITIIIIFVSRITKNRVAVRKKRLIEHYEEIISSFLFSDENVQDSHYLQRFTQKSVAKTGFQKTILAHLLSKIHDNFLGDSQLLIERMYHEHELEKMALKNLHSIRWSNRAKAANISGKMNVKEAIPTLKVLVSDRNRQVRIQAIIALIRLRNDKPLSFLSGIRFELTDWEQVQILKALERYNTNEIHLEASHFETELATVLGLVIRIAIQFNKTESSSTILSFLRHANTTVRMRVLSACKSLTYIESVDILKTYFDEAAIHEKIQIIDVISVLITEDDGFFLNIFENEELDESLRLAAAKGLANVSNGYAHMELINKEEMSIQSKLSKHVLDWRL
ncbi:hypothetical protein EP331_10045 [bacterium]|nr:MAG: hypothetical protein EP331_10045 [bacterium]